MKTNNDLTAAKFGQRLRNQRKNLLKTFEKENELIKSNHVKNKDQARLTAAKEILDIHDQSDRDQNFVINQNQSKLVDHKQQLEKESKLLKTQLDTLSKTQKSQITDMNFRFDEKYKDQFNDAMVKSDRIFKQNHNEISNLENTSKREVQRHKFQTTLKANNNSRQNDREIIKQNNGFKMILDNNKDINRRELELQKLDHMKKVSDQKFLNDNEKSEKVLIHKNKIAKIKEKHIAALKQETESFQRKFKNLQGNHQAILDRVDNKFNAQANETISKHANQKLSSHKMLDDPFYNITKLTPKLKETPSSYEVSLKIPEYESQKIRLSAQDRKVTISMTRAFKENNTDTTGTRHSTQRSEVLYQHFTTNHILDNSKISQGYKEGILTFTIAKK